MNHATPTVLVAACYCIGQVASRNKLPIPIRNPSHPVKYGTFDGLPTESSAATSSEGVKFGSLTKHRLVERLLHLAVEKDIPHKVSS